MTRIPVAGPARFRVTRQNVSRISERRPIIEYYILCPKRPDNEEGLITHLISRDICRERQLAFFHKCPNCMNRDPSITRGVEPPAVKKAAAVAAEATDELAKKAARKS